MREYIPFTKRGGQNQRSKHESQHESINFHYNNNSLNAPIVQHKMFEILSEEHLSDENINSFCFPD